MGIHEILKDYEKTNTAFQASLFSGPVKVFPTVLLANTHIDNKLEFKCTAVVAHEIPEISALKIGYVSIGISYDATQPPKLEYHTIDGLLIDHGKDIRLAFRIYPSNMNPADTESLKKAEQRFYLISALDKRGNVVVDEGNVHFEGRYENNTTVVDNRSFMDTVHDDVKYAKRHGDNHTIRLTTYDVVKNNIHGASLGSVLVSGVLTPGVQSVWRWLLKQ